MIAPVIVELPDGRLGCKTCGEIFARDWRHYHAQIAGREGRVILTHPGDCTCGICRAVPCARRERGA